MAKIVVVAVICSLLAMIWVLAGLEQKAMALWGPWYQCGSGQFYYNGHYYYKQQTCENYYWRGTSGAVEETIANTCYWQWNGVSWSFYYCTNNYVIYYCNLTQYQGGQCASF